MSSEPQCWSERSSHLARPMDQRDHFQSLWEPCAAQNSTAAAKVPICSFQPAAPQQLGKRLSCQEQTQGCSRCSHPHKHCKCNTLHTSWKKALTLPQPPLNSPDTSSPKEVPTGRGEGSRRPQLLPGQEHRRQQQQTRCPCLFPAGLPAATPTTAEESLSDLGEALPDKILQVSSTLGSPGKMPGGGSRLTGKLRAWPRQGSSCLMSPLAHAWCQVGRWEHTAHPFP